MILSWNHALGQTANHVAAAEALACKLGWSGAWFGGGLPGSGYCFVDGSPNGCRTTVAKPLEPDFHRAAQRRAEPWPAPAIPSSTS